MRTLTCCLVLMLVCSTAWAQLPPNQPEQDCFNAIPLCQDTYFQANSYQGAGRDTDEINGTISCMLIGEQNSVWYTFRAATTGELCFTIIPVDSADDYDWAVFDLTGSSCAQIRNNPNMAVACNWTYNIGCEGETGANGRTDCPGQFEGCLQVIAGQSFALNVSNFTASNSGYTIDFSQSTARLFDDIPPKITKMESFCSGVRVFFSENINCSTLDTTDFTFSGPGGPYHISEVLGPCESQGFGNYVDLIMSPRITQAGNYNVALTGYIGDICGNGASASTFQVFMEKPPLAEIFAELTPVAESNCELENQWIYTYTGPSDVVTYDWTFGDGESSFFPNPVHHYDTYGDLVTQLTITDEHGCRDSATTTVTVFPKPAAGLSIPFDVCIGEEVTMLQASSARGGSDLTRSRWEIEDEFFTDNTLTYTFNEPGPQDVLLTVWNTLNCKDTLRHYLTVHPKPIVDFQPYTTLCLVELANVSSLAYIDTSWADDSLVQWIWAWGDSMAADTGATASHLYATGDTFGLTLTVASNYGCEDSLTLPQVVHDPTPTLVLLDTVCFGDSATLVSVPAPNSEILWYDSPTSGSPLGVGPVYITGPITVPQEFYATQELFAGCISERVPLAAHAYPASNGTVIATPEVVSFPDPTVAFQFVGSVEPLNYLWSFTNLDSATDAAPSFTFQNSGLQEVLLQVLDIYGCEYQFTSTIEVEPIPEIYAPNAFSPNGDGINEEWYISALLMEELQLSIFNRKGSLVAQSNNTDFRWDGRSSQGQPLPEGVYVFRLTGTNAMGTSVTQTGTVTLIR